MWESNRRLAPSSMNSQARQYSQIMSTKLQGMGATSQPLELAVDVSRRGSGGLVGVVCHRPCFRRLDQGRLRAPLGRAYA